ncbi:MAG: class F sortase [Candidatus Saccharimonadales bacterium]
MADRPQIGLNNPSLRGRLRQSGTRKLFTQPTRQTKQNSPTASLDDVSAAGEDVAQTEPIPAERPKGQVFSEINSAVSPKSKPPGHSEKPHVFLVPSGARTEQHNEPTQIQEQPIPSLEPISAPPISQYIQPAIENQRSFEPEQSMPSLFKQAAVKKQPIIPLTRAQALAVVAAIAVVFLGSFAAFSMLNSNHSAVTQISGAANSLSEGTAGSSSPPSTTKPDGSSIVNYQVALNDPRYISIPKLNVQARVMTLGGLLSQTSNYPYNIYDTGWYDQSSLPGEPGAMIISGHTSYNGSKGVFSNLVNLVPGDRIIVDRGDGIAFTYQVLKSVEYKDGNIDTQSVLQPIDPTSQSLNLVTAPNEGIPGVDQNKARLVVYTVQI